MTPKRRKVDYDGLCEVAWEHWNNYLESIDEENNEEGDIDELVELLSNLEGSSASIEPSATATLDTDQSPTVLSLLPVLVSVASTVLADSAITRYLQTQDQNEWKQACQHLHRALRFFPSNASARSMASNTARMTHTLPLATITTWYEAAAESSSKVQSKAMTWLNEVKDEKTLEWIENLLLNQVVGVEFESEDDCGERWSSSAVEATSRFMCAMLQSMQGRHADALNHLKHFDLTHRIHPNVWNSFETSESTPETSIALYQSEKGILPIELYDRLCAVFAPEAAYWEESSYSNRGYYSYFMDKPEKPSNLMEDVILNRLLPLVEGKTSEPIVGFEWWVHTRPLQANLGHNLHFDTDEALLSQQQKVTHPIFSSVLYLTGDAPSGATIVFNQTPESKQVSNVCWKNTPRNNTFLVFPGNLLHGVLPCPGDTALLAEDDRTATPSLDTQQLIDAKDPSLSSKQHRLTLLVGFWTRRVPDQMKEQKLYGPCGAMPPATDEHSWVKEMMQGYPEDKGETSMAHTTIGSIQSCRVPCIRPAWEQISDVEKEDESVLLDVPHGIDHRYFVKGAPQCFRDCLFEKDEFDDHEEEEEEGASFPDE